MAHPRKISERVSSGPSVITYLSAGSGDDSTDGGSGNDTYSYQDGWGTDTVVDASGFDTLNFSAVSGAGGIIAWLYPEASAGAKNEVSDPGTPKPVVNVSTSNPLSVIEKVVGSASDHDVIAAGGADNILQPGPGTGGAELFDFGGTADKLILPFASTDAYFEVSDLDGDGSVDSLLIMSTDYVLIHGQLEPYYDEQGHIETIQFTHGDFSIRQHLGYCQPHRASGCVECSFHAKRF